MQLLFEEVFRKFFKFLDESPIFVIKHVVKLIFYLAILLIFVLIGWLIFKGKYVWVLLISGFFITGELAHYIRKSRHKVMQKRVREHNIENKKPINEKGLIPKNDSLLPK